MASLVVADELESVGENLLQHERPVFVGILPFWIRDRLEIESLRPHPRRSADDLVALEAIGNLNEIADGLVLGYKVTPANRVEAVVVVRVAGLDGGDGNSWGWQARVATRLHGCLG